MLYTNVVLYNLNEIKNYSEGALDICLFISMLINSVIATVGYNAKIAVFNKIADPKLGSVQLTLLFSFHDL